MQLHTWWRNASTFSAFIPREEESYWKMTGMLLLFSDSKNDREKIKFLIWYSCIFPLWMSPLVKKFKIFKIAHSHGHGAHRIVTASSLTSSRPDCGLWMNDR